MTMTTPVNLESNIYDDEICGNEDNVFSSYSTLDQQCAVNLVQQPLVNLVPQDFHQIIGGRRPSPLVGKNVHIDIPERRKIMYSPYCKPPPQYMRYPAPHFNQLRETQRSFSTGNLEPIKTIQPTQPFLNPAMAKQQNLNFKKKCVSQNLEAESKSQTSAQSRQNQTEAMQAAIKISVKIEEEEKQSPSWKMVDWNTKYKNEKASSLHSRLLTQVQLEEEDMIEEPGEAEQFMIMVPEPQTDRKLRNRKYLKRKAEKQNYYAKDELTKKIMRDLREQLYKSFISIIPHSKLSNRGYQLAILKEWLKQTQNITEFEKFDEQNLVTVFCHLRVRKNRAKSLKTGLHDLEQILAGSKFKTIQFLRTKTGRSLFYERFKALWRHKVNNCKILKSEELRYEFAKYFKSIESEVEAKVVLSKPTRGKPSLRLIQQERTEKEPETEREKEDAF